MRQSRSAVRQSRGTLAHSWRAERRAAVSSGFRGRPTFRVGGPPPWAGLDPPTARLLARRRPPPAAALAARAPTPVSLVPGSVSAAVLVPLLEIDGEAHVVFIKRPETMSTHKGEIAFPGGKLDPGGRHRPAGRGAARGAGGDRARPGRRRDRRPARRASRPPRRASRSRRSSASSTGRPSSSRTRARSCGCSRCRCRSCSTPRSTTRNAGTGSAGHVGVLLRAGRRDHLGRDRAYPDRSPHAARRHRRVITGSRDRREANMDIEEFYAADERRRHSAELEFGRDWSDAGGRVRGVVGRGHRRAVPDARARRRRRRRRVRRHGRARRVRARARCRGARRGRRAATRSGR